MLNLRGCTDLKNINGLPVMPKLRWLDLRGCTGLKNLNGLLTLVQNTGVKTISLRHKPERTLSEDSVELVLQERNFFDSDKNAVGEGLSYFYVVYDIQEASVIMDYATGLMWQQVGAGFSGNWMDAQEYVKRLNRERFAGYDDWRLSTLEEAMSLMELKKMHGDLYIDSIFDKEQRWIWTADEESAERTWVVSFGGGLCLHDDDIGGSRYVRAVRSG